MQLTSLFAVFCGAGLGAICRWLLGLALNPVFPTLPLGTLAANLIGGFLMGVVLALFDQMQALSPAVRLAIITGFLGGLTTFSTFSGETVSLLLRQQYAATAAIMLAHTLGSILATLCGFGVIRAVLRS